MIINLMKWKTNHHAINEKYKDYTNEQLHDYLKSIDEEVQKHYILIIVDVF